MFPAPDSSLVVLPPALCLPAITGLTPILANPDTRPLTQVLIEEERQPMQHSTGFLKLVNAAKARVKETTVDEVSRRLQAGEKLTMVDVREDSEWQKGHIQGAVHLGKGIVERDAERTFPTKDRELILYCGGGFRSALAANALQQMGYTNVVSMDGGWREWNEKNLPVER